VLGQQRRSHRHGRVERQRKKAPRKGLAARWCFHDGAAAGSVAEHLEAAPQRTAHEAHELVRQLAQRSRVNSCGRQSRRALVNARTKRRALPTARIQLRQRQPRVLHHGAQLQVSRGVGCSDGSGGSQHRSRSCICNRKIIVGSHINDFASETSSRHLRSGNGPCNALALGAHGFHLFL
jgi:hypothetical protein